MTKPRYPQGCAAGSEVRGIAAPLGNAWNVSLHNGNSNVNHQDNRNCALAVRVSECHLVTVRHLHTAWRSARRGKKPSHDRLAFDICRMDRLIEIEPKINAGTWTPDAPLCFIAPDPKAREIHAPTFADRVVHHWLVPWLEKLYEPSFIHDSYSNRVGKGSHAAVRRLQAFVRQVHSGQGGGYYLQLDIKNFFNTIHRPTLYGFLKARMERASLPFVVQRCVHALLNNPLSRTGVRWACSERERAAVPPHKRLENAAPGCGLAIGNLFSQFGANVYLDRLDQFLKHVLKVKWYLRYVDDFVLLHSDPEQLRTWRDQIEAFLASELRLELKADQKLLPLHRGIDFLGYVVYPHHCVVRRRVIAHCRSKLAHFERIGAGATREGREQIRSTWASYAGHFRHACSYRLQQRIHARFPWLPQILKEFECS